MLGRFLCRYRERIRFPSASLIDQHYVAAATIFFAFLHIELHPIGRGRAGTAREIEQRFCLRLLIKRRQHHHVQPNRPTDASLTIFKNGYLAAEQFFIDSLQPAWLEPGQPTRTLIFRTIAKREDQQQARCGDESRRK
jgi:hypothetical protein